MVDKLYEGKGKTPQEAREKLFKTASTEGVSNLEGTVLYEVAVVGKRGKMVCGKEHEDYALAFASALSAAKVNPDKYDPTKTPFEVTVRATYQVSGAENYRTAAGARAPSGSAPNAYTGKGLTDLF